ncbi:hypothetical protein ABZX77_25800 [Streptomyces sp. NPDC004237]|uniref:hypothetical protein n=1 Tax=Streptomyces sp. NPDC004237 TaxID=3154455 RepID=UPI0033A485DD
MTDSDIRRRGTHVNDVLRVLCAVAAMLLFFSASSVLVAYAGIRMGVSPEVCWVGSVGSGPMLVRSFIRLFESVRPALPKAPEDRPSIDGP